MIFKKKFKIPKRVEEIGSGTGRFFIRDCPQLKNQTIVGELWETKDQDYPYCIVYLENYPIMKDGFMTWYFTSLDQVNEAKFKELTE